MRKSGWASRPFANGEGPLIALPFEAMAEWHATEYERARASAARRPFDTIETLQHRVLTASATAGRLAAAYWLRLPGDPNVLLVGREFGWDVESHDNGTGNEQAEDWLEWRLREPGVDWASRGWSMTVRSGIVLLAHAAAPAEGVRLTSHTACVGEAVPCAVEPGRYALETMTLDDPLHGGPVRCSLCRWTRVVPVKERRRRRDRSSVGSDQDRSAVG